MIVDYHLGYEEEFQRTGNDALQELVAKGIKVSKETVQGTLHTAELHVIVQERLLCLSTVISRSG